jgi:uncharacterized iron-regulated membrane protein
MKRLRKVIFWCHLPIGVLGGLVILVMCVTGVLLSYERQITSWADTRGYVISGTASGPSRLPVDTIITRAREGRTGNPTSLTIRATPTAPVEVTFGREGSAFVNPYSGEVLGNGSPGVRNFFRRVTELHRWLGAQGDNRNVARAITGACNLGFLFLVVSGFYLWWPKSWNKNFIRNITWFKRGLSARARNFNWHNTIGFWSAVPLFIVVLSAVVISYSWAGNLVYRIVGETPPVPRSNQSTSSPTNKQSPLSETLTGVDDVWKRAEQHVEGWQSISLQLPTNPTAPLIFNIDRGNGGQPQKRGQLTIDRSGQVVRWEGFTNYSRGRQLRSLLRFAHTGEVAGIVGQTVAGLVSAGGAFLVWTGLALALRRFRGWAGRRFGTSKTESGATLDALPYSTAD